MPPSIWYGSPVELRVQPNRASIPNVRGILDMGALLGCVFPGCWDSYSRSQNFDKHKAIDDLGPQIGDPHRGS